MNIAIMTAWLSRSAGGFPSAIRPFAEALSEVDKNIVDIIGAVDPKFPNDWRDWGRNVHAAQIWGPAAFSFTPRTLKILKKIDPDLLDVQGLWTYPSLANLSFAGRDKKPYAITPRGTLSPTALHRSAWRKRVVSLWFESRHLAGARVLRATARMEAEYFRAYGLTNPIAVVSDGVSIPLLHNVPKAANRMRRALFLGRIHPIKGVDLLLRVWSHLSVYSNEWELLIVGPSDGRYRWGLNKLEEELNLSNVEWRAQVNDEEKNNILAEVDLLILPSRTENFGLVVAEALAHGVPVITTKNAPWDGLLRNNCGWWVEFSEELLAKALNDAMSLTDAERIEMGARGRAWMERDFSWPAIAKQMQEVYSWVLGGGAAPACVMTD